MQHENAKIRLLALSSQFLHRCLNVLFEFPDRVLERRARVVDFVDNEHVFADQVGHFEGGQVEPLRAGYFCAGGFDVGVGGGVEGFVEGEADGLDGDVGSAGLFEEGAVCYVLDVCLNVGGV
jgi:hypothetical protein